MNILIHCGGMPFNGTTIEHQSLGGSETSAYYLAKQLVKKGHRVVIFTAIDKEEQGNFDGVEYVSQGSVTELTPLGKNFHLYAENTPMDVCIIQRHPLAFRFRWASKVNIWWLHDLAIRKNKQEISKHMWNVDKIWTVSEFHKQQIIKVWGIEPGLICPVVNGIDFGLIKESAHKFPDTFDCSGVLNNMASKNVLLYSSRPERGLENLVSSNGIMERLGEDYHLLVCSYANDLALTKGYYDHIDERCDKLSNVTMLGHLTKSELYSVMKICDFHVYPTNFEEVSCITAMEVMACGLPMITSMHAALPGTCKNSGTKMVKLKDNGDVDVELFTKVIAMQCSDTDYDMKVAKQLKSATKYSWDNVIEGYSNSIKDSFYNRSVESMIKHLIEHGDIIALKVYIRDAGYETLSDYSKWLIDKTIPLYDFIKTPELMQKHYESHYESHESDLTKPTMENSPRFLHVASLVSSYDNGSNILDYGCGHGHLVINLAKQYPDLIFIGIDISNKNIQFAKDWAKEDNVLNVEFYHADIMQGWSSIFWSEQVDTLDGVLCCEVMEHVEDYYLLGTRLMTLLKDGGKFIATTPYGRWEWQSFEEHAPSRFHVHHFERDDIVDMIGSQDSYFITNIPAGNDRNGFLLGSYVWGFIKDVFCDIDRINYNRKFSNLKPRQLCSLNMIAKDCEDTIVHSIKGSANFVDEVVVGIDDTSNKSTRNAVEDMKDYLAAKDVMLTVVSAGSALELGFSDLRNYVLSRTSLDWVLWVDADEVIKIDSITRRLLRSNQFNGYAIKQHHFSIDPPKVLKTDLPLRLFRTDRGITFFGMVHEHPEIELNDGAGHAQLIDSISIAHYGYDTENTRKNRFERNLDLMMSDRVKNPTRKLGKMLWIRDLSLMNQYELEFNGMRLTDNMVVRCREGLKVWRELVEEGETRMVLESMEFYNKLLEIVGYEFSASISIGMNKYKGVEGAPPIVKGLFVNRKDFENLTALLIEENYDDFNSKYY